MRKGSSASLLSKPQLSVKWEQWYSACNAHYEHQKRLGHSVLSIVSRLLAQLDKRCSMTHYPMLGRQDSISAVGECWPPNSRCVRSSEDRGQNTPLLGSTMGRWREKATILILPFPPLPR